MAVEGVSLHCNVIVTLVLQLLDDGQSVNVKIFDAFIDCTVSL